MHLFRVFYSVQLNRKTVNRRATVTATSPSVAERMIRAWLQLQRLKAYSITTEA